MKFFEFEIAGLMIWKLDDYLGYPFEYSQNPKIMESFYFEIFEEIP